MTATLLRYLVFASVGLTLVATAAPDRPRLVDESKLAREWVPAGAAPLAQATYPVSVTDLTLDACINLGYQIDETGKTSNFSVLKSWTSKDPAKTPTPKESEPFVQQAAAAVLQWRFVRAPGAGPNKMIYTSTNIAFLGDSGSSVDKVKAGCTINDINAHIAQLQDKSMRRGNLGKEKIERYDRENPAIERAMQEAMRNSSSD